MGRYIVCGFIGAICAVTWVAWALAFLPHIWWIMPVIYGGGLLLMGGGIGIGLWWMDQS